MVLLVDKLQNAFIRVFAALRTTNPREVLEKCTHTYARLQAAIKEANSASALGVSLVFIIGMLAGIILGAAMTVAVNFDNGIDTEQLAGIIEEEVKLREAERAEKTLDLNGNGQQEDKKRV